ncbi:phenylacetate--CoA ligase family protein [Nocardia sp. NPDC059240]|uniref:phenylacetate--CoA ligase family protein n=1 Tax=Nocardia sp. NPDC059240 TaxID=3346786 RepID=UPI003688BF28
MSAPTPPLEGRGFIHARDLLHRAARPAPAGVPAYEHFLSAHGIDAEAVRTAADFALVTPTDKAEYLSRYELPELMWSGRIYRAAMWSAGSGQSGCPTYFPRGRRAAVEATTMFTRTVRKPFRAGTRSTLLVVGFAGGDWIANTYTVAAGIGMHERGARVSVVAPGIDIEAILHDIAVLGPHYDQVVLAAYPLFAKDVLDRAGDEVLRQDVKLVLAGEIVSEGLRDYLLERLGKPDRPGDIRLIYGTAEAGVLGHETDTSITVRRLAGTDAALSHRLFGDTAVIPTLVEYDPEYRYFETDGHGRLLFTVDNELPLIRYRIGDVGRVLTAGDVEEALRECGYRVPVTTSAAGCGFVTVAGRPDVATTFYSVKMYPDGVRTALADPRLSAMVSGKCVLDSMIAPDHSQTLTLQVELALGAHPEAGLPETLREVVVAALEHTSTEYRRLRETIGGRAEPVITVHPHGSPQFRYTTKHRWTGGRR